MEVELTKPIGQLGILKDCSPASVNPNHAAREGEEPERLSQVFPKKEKGLLLEFRKPFSFNRIGCGGQI